MKRTRPLRAGRGIGGRRWRAAWLLCAALTLVSLLSVRVALAETVRLQADAGTAEVGAPIRVTLVVLSEQGELPANPVLQKPAGFTARGPTTSSRTQVSFMNGRLIQAQGIDATWVVVASKPGRFRLGPATVNLGTRRVRSNSVEIEVVPEGQAPRRRPGAFGPGFDPFGFDPFGRSFPGFGFPRLPGFDEPAEDEERAPEDIPELPEEYRVAVPKDPVAFLRAEVEPKRVVVGEPVIYRAYAYARMGEFEEAGAGEPPTRDFVKYPVIENSADQPIVRGRLGEQLWSTKKLREMVLVPVHTGRLRIGEISMTFVNRAGLTYVHRGKPVQRSTSPVDVIVTEPPMEGRPPGYELGDVGDFRLSADVRPREVSVGEALSVVVKLDGTGNLPLRLSPPAQHGLVWLEPNVTQEISAQQGTLGGWRRFTYLVRAERAGRFELGRFALPYWDPAAKEYRTASVDLGAIVVAPGSGGDAAPVERPEGQLAGIGELRRALGPAVVAPPRLLDRSWFWLLLASPLLVSSAQVLARGGRAFTRWSRERGSSITAQRTRALREAQAEIGAGQRLSAATALERVLFLAIEETTGLRARGILRAELAAELRTAGVPDALARQIVEKLDRLDAIRFEGDTSISPAEELTAVEALVAELRRGQRPNRARRSR